MITIHTTWYILAINLAFYTVVINLIVELCRSWFFKRKTKLAFRQAMNAIEDFAWGVKTLSNGRLNFNKEVFTNLISNPGDFTLKFELSKLDSDTHFNPIPELNFEIDGNVLSLTWCSCNEFPEYSRTHIKVWVLGYTSGELPKDLQNLLEGTWTKLANLTLTNILSGK